MKMKAALSLIGLGMVILWFCPCMAADRSITLPKGTQILRIGPGHYKFTLPDNKVVEVTGLDANAHTVSLLRVIDLSSKKVLWGGKQGRMVDAKKMNNPDRSTVRSSNYARPGDVVFVFPLTFSLNETSDANLLAEFMKLNTNDASKPSVSSVPDLAIENFDIGIGLARGGEFYILRLLIKNNGDPSTPTVVIFSGSPEVINIYGLSNPKSIPGIAQGQGHIMSLHPANNSSDIPVGTYHLSVVVNPNNSSFYEGSIKNNKVEAFIEVTDAKMTMGPKHGTWTGIGYSEKKKHHRK